MAQLSESRGAGEVGHIADTNALHRKANYVFDVLDFGTVGDGTTDDATAIQAAIDAAEAVTPRGTVFFPDLKYKIDTGITILDCDIDASPSAVLLVDTAVTTAVTIGSSSQSCDWHRISLPWVQMETQQWVGSPVSIGIDIGVLVSAADNTEFRIPRIIDFSYGLKLEGDGQGVAYNEFHLGNHNDNAINLFLTEINSGWANQNLFFGGRFTLGQNGASGRIVGTRSILIGRNADTSHPNNNTFVGCSLEGEWQEFALECWGSNNQFINCRWESSGNDNAAAFRAFDSGNFAFNNLIQGGNDLENLIVTNATNTIRNNILHAQDTVYEFADGQLNFRAVADAEYRINIDATLGRIFWSDGTFDPRDASGPYIRNVGANVMEVARGSWRPNPSATHSLGSTARQWKDLHLSGGVGFYGTAPAAKPTVTGARDDGTALADLLTELETLGLLTDSSTAS